MDRGPGEALGDEQGDEDDYDEERRVRGAAADLLIEGDLNVTEISYKVGFQSPTYFYKCFKEKYGVPPSKYGKSPS